MDTSGAHESKPCPTCNGSGRIIPASPSIVSKCCHLYEIQSHGTICKLCGHVAAWIDSRGTARPMFEPQMDGGHALPLTFGDASIEINRGLRVKFTASTGFHT